MIGTPSPCGHSLFERENVIYQQFSMIYIPPLEEEVDSTQVEDGGVLIFYLLVYSGNSLPLRGLPPCPSAFAMRMLRV